MKQPEKHNIAIVATEHLCLSCGACHAVCRHGSISYHETVGGYLFPEVDENTCVNCGLCYEVCPGIHFSKSLIEQMPVDPFVGNILTCRVGKATNETIFQNSQSGGIATALLAYLLETGQISGAIVATMQTATPPRAGVMLAKTVDDLLVAQKSKYLPIPLLSALSQLKTAEGSVAIVGLPCHIHGLSNLLSLYPDLRSKVFIKIGLICDRVQTNAVVDFLGLKATAQNMDYLTFRDKQRPSYPGNPVIKMASGDEVVLDASVRMAIKDFFTPPRCRLCFDKLNVYADVVLGDPHGLKGIDRQHGETLVLTRTQKGKDGILAAESAGYIATRYVDVQNAVNGQKTTQKQFHWSGYMKSWSELGRRKPEFPPNVQIRAQIPIQRNRKYKADLLRGINLDDYSSRSAVLSAADKWLLKRKIMAEMRQPYVILMSVAGRILKRIKGAD